MPTPEHCQAWPQLGTILRPATSTAKLVGLVLFGELEAPMPTPDHRQAWPQLGTILRARPAHLNPEAGLSTLERRSLLCSQTRRRTAQDLSTLERRSLLCFQTRRRTART